VLAEQRNEWTEGRRSMSLEVLAKSRIRIVTPQPSTPHDPATTTGTLGPLGFQQDHADSISYTSFADAPNQRPSQATTSRTLAPKKQDSSRHTTERRCRSS
jgi:hypothetical protein